MLINKQELASLIDHTLLKPDTGREDILRLCHEAITYSFQAVCINPAHVALAAQTLVGSGIAVCTVVGFPLGAATTEIKAAEALGAVQDGADEIDMVINLGLLKDDLPDLFLEDVRRVVQAVTAGGKPILVKTIIETCFLSTQQKITATRLCEQAGAHIIKTSTGFGPAGATIEDIQLIKNEISPGTGIKASGGIKTLEQTLLMYRAGATRIGTSSGVQIMKELL